MMNMQFADITATGKVIIYMDDILIATEDDLTKHRKLVNQVLERLDKLDLYLKPSKCQFKVWKIEFLGVVLEGGTVTMDLIKVAGVQDWKTPKKTRDVRAFLLRSRPWWVLHGAGSCLSSIRIGLSHRCLTGLASLSHGLCLLIVL